MTRLLLTLGCALAIAALGVHASDQAAAVRGKLTCGGQPAKGIKVKLYEVDTLDPDDLMQEGVTNEDGEFELQGFENEYTEIEPKLNIYNSCHKGILPCPKKISIRFPKQCNTEDGEELPCITPGQKPAVYFDAGTLNLNGEFSGAHYDCIN